MNTTKAILCATLIGVAALTACSSDSGASGGGDDGDLVVQLRRVEISTPGFSELGLTVIALVDNGGGSEIVVSGGDVSVSIAGPSVQEDDEDDDDAAEEDGDSDDEEEGEEDDGDDDGPDDDGADDDDGTASEDAPEGDADGNEPEVNLDPEGIVTGDWYEGATTGGKVPGGAQAELPFAVTLPLPTDVEARERMIRWQTVNLNVKGTASAGGSIASFEGVREIRMPLFPKLELEAQVAKMDDGAGGGQVFMYLNLENPNAFPLVVDRIAYAIRLGDKEMLPMGDGDSEEVPPGAVRPIEEQIKLNEETYGPTVRQLLRQPTVPYEVNGTMTIAGMELPFAFKGEMAFPR